MFERGARTGLEDVDRELIVELAVRDAVAGSGDPLGLVGVEQAELAVHTRRGGLDPAEPARDRNRDRLTGDGEVGDRLARLGAPELVLLAAVSLTPRMLAGAAVSSSSSQPTSFTRGRPSGSPAARSAASIACQPAYST